MQSLKTRLADREERAAINADEAKLNDTARQQTFQAIAKEEVELRNTELGVKTPKMAFEDKQGQDPYATKVSSITAANAAKTVEVKEAQQADAAAVAAQPAAVTPQKVLSTAVAGAQEAQDAGQNPFGTPPASVKAAKGEKAAK